MTQARITHCSLSCSGKYRTLDSGTLAQHRKKKAIAVHLPIVPRDPQKRCLYFNYLNSFYFLEIQLYLLGRRMGKNPLSSNPFKFYTLFLKDQTLYSQEGRVEITVSDQGEVEPLPNL